MNFDPGRRTLFIYFIFFFLFWQLFSFNLVDATIETIVISLQTDKQKAFICDTIQSRFVSIFVVCWIVVKFMQNANGRQLCHRVYSAQHTACGLQWDIVIICDCVTENLSSFTFQITNSSLVKWKCGQGLHCVLCTLNTEHQIPVWKR